MKKFFAITNNVQKPTNERLQAACAARDIEYEAVNPASFDYIHFPTPVPSDMVYRVGTNVTNVRVEQYFVSRHVTSFHTGVGLVFFNCTNPTLLFEYNNLPTIKTIYSLTTNKERLREYVAYLGGFPVVIKILGGSNGRGVIRVDSTAALFSTVDYLTFIGRQAYLMAYIEHIAYRHIVLGDRVVAAYVKKSADDDFRAQTGFVIPDMPVPDNMKELAVKATQLIQLEFGGVDILVNKKLEMYVTEVNFPCTFFRAEEATGVDIAGLMVDYLLDKSTENK